MNDKTLTSSLARLPRVPGSALHEDIVWSAQTTWAPPWRLPQARPLTSVDSTSVEDLCPCSDCDVRGLRWGGVARFMRDHHDVSSAAPISNPVCSCLTSPDEEDARGS